MRRTILTLTFIAFLLVSPAAGQKLGEPKLESVPLTPEQRQTLKEGVALHDRGDYAGAINRYEEVLKGNPNNAEVLYEMAYTYYSKKDYAKSLEMAYKAAQYKSDFLGRVYILIGNTLDDSGDSKTAIETYKAGIKLQPSNYLLHYNLAITYTGAEMVDDARAAAKKSAALNPNHASSQILLSTLFFNGDYKTPALLAASRFLILEPTSQRADTTLQIVQRVMQAGVSPSQKENEINIFVDMSPKKKDEGDFSSVEMFMGLAKAANYTEKSKGKTQMQLLADNFESLLSFLSEAKDKDQSKFTWKYYVPYFLEMKKRGFIEPFVYYTHQRSNAPGVKEWLQQNEAKVREFLSWSKSYSWPKPD